MKTESSVAGRIASAVARRRFRIVTEKDFQEALVRVFEAEKMEYRREVRLGPGDVVDFMVGDVAVEVKVEGSPTQVLRQILRYLEYGEVSALVLVTRRAGSARGIPPQVLGKPVIVVPVWKGFL